MGWHALRNEGRGLPLLHALRSSGRATRALKCRRASDFCCPKRPGPPSVTLTRLIAPAQPAAVRAIIPGSWRLPTIYRPSATCRPTRSSPIAATCAGSSSGSANARSPACRSIELADYAGWLHGQQLAPASLARHLVSLKLFFRYLQLEGVLAENAAELLGSQKLWQRVPVVLAPHQVNRLFDCPRQGDPSWRRDRAMLELLYATGCRASELSSLEVRDVHLDEGYLHVSRQRGQTAVGSLGTPGGRGRGRCISNTSGPPALGLPRRRRLGCFCLARGVVCAARGFGSW